jgi:GNAT superfamily N-acetyltransferase
MSRLATLEDIPSWLALVRDVEPLFGAMPDFEAHARRNIDRGTAIVAHAAARVLGAALLSRADQPHSINWLAVRADARRRGVGSELLNVIINRWPAGNITVVTFGPDVPGGQPARRLYERYGFTSRGPASPGPDGGGRNLYVLER